MTSFAITPANSVVATASDALSSASGNDTVDVATNAYLMATGLGHEAVAFFGGSGGYAAANINGTVTSGNASALYFSGQSRVDVTVGLQGFVAGNNGIQTFSPLNLTNNGVISGDNGGVSVLASSGASRISNNGLIGTASGYAISFSASAVLNLTNSGTITGPGAISMSSGSSINLINGGLIFGALTLGDSADTIDTRAGHIFTPIDLFGGDDAFFGSDDAEVVSGGTGADTIDFGGGNDSFIVVNVDGDDILDGGNGIHTYDAKAVSGAVTIDLDDGTAIGGSVGFDLLENFENAIGSDGGNDTIIGTAGANMLSGMSGADNLFGAGGRDTLKGGIGADTLSGGLGRDVLYGGGIDAAADIFNFDAISDSGVASATRDWIMDFEDGLDRIDLSTIDARTQTSGNQAFTVIAGAFTTAGGQIKVTVSGGNTWIQINNDKDTAADMSIMVKGTPTLTAADFIL